MKGLFLQFPDFRTKAVIGSDELYLDALPLNMSLLEEPTIPFQDEQARLTCRHMQQFQDRVLQETEHIDNILHLLHLSYQNIKTKRQLDMEVPAGFRKMSHHAQLFNEYHSLNHNIGPADPTITADTTDATSPSLSLLSNIEQEAMSEVLDSVDSSYHDTSSSPSVPTPIVRSVDKPSSSLPHVITMSEDYLCSSLGFQCIDTLKQHFSELYNPTVCLYNSPPDAVLDPGHFASIRKSPRNTMPVPRSSYFGKVMHMDIVFGPEVAVHYGLLFSDHHSRMNYVYLLRNLTADIPKQLEAFFAHIGFVPRRSISDFDLKLIGGRARKYLNSLLVHVNAAPATRQDRNGLVERHWKTMLAMARNWLASAELPASFWYYAIRCTAEVCNYFPYKLEDGSFPTPFQLVHKVKPDLRVLFPMFGLAAVRRDQIGDSTLSKFEAQSVFMIAIGRCQQSNGLQFLILQMAHCVIHRL